MAPNMITAEGFDKFVDIPGIAKLLGVSKPTVNQWRHRTTTQFPQPDVSRWADKPLWHIDTVLAWYEQWCSSGWRGAPGVPRRRRGIPVTRRQRGGDSP